MEGTEQAVGKDQPIIELVDVYKKYPNGTQALKGVTLRVKPGEFVFVVGPSGSGKSTLIKLLMAEESATSGEVRVNGYDLMHIKKRKISFLRRGLGVVFQDFRLIGNMNVYNNIAFALRVSGASARTIRKRIPYILDIVGLGNKGNVYPTELSGGEQQRVALARALVNNPAILIADEPTGNVDPKMSTEIIDLLDEVNSRGTTVLVVTHEMNLVNHLRKRVVYIDTGRIESDKAEGTYEREWISLPD